jgi:hypothetical protein
MRHHEAFVSSVCRFFIAASSSFPASLEKRDKAEARKGPLPVLAEARSIPPTHTQHKRLKLSRQPSLNFLFLPNIQYEHARFILLHDYFPIRKTIFDKRKLLYNFTHCISFSNDITKGFNISTVMKIFTTIFLKKQCIKPLFRQIFIAYTVLQIVFFGANLAIFQVIVSRC